MLYQEFSEVGRGQAMEGLVGEEEELILNTIAYRKPVELLKNGGDVFPGLGVGKQAGG